jgi:NAD+ diphosphatase
MENAEDVTFGGSGLDRGGALRNDRAAIEKAKADPSSRAVVLWQGKPLIKRDRPAAVLRLAMDHPIVQPRVGDAVFLGLEQGEARFAIDFSDWVPGDDSADTVGSFVDPSEQQHPDLPNGDVFAELRRIMTWLSPRDAELAATAKAILGWHRTHGFCAACGVATQIVMAGWQRQCPACKTGHFPRTDPVVIMLITHGNAVLVGRSHGWPEGMYSLLAGFVEPGETIEAAVRREVLEETGVAVGQVRYLASQPWPFPSSLMIGCAGEALSTQITVDPDEIEAAMWVSREEMLDVFSGVNPDMLPARKGAIAHFLLQRWLEDTA